MSHNKGWRPGNLYEVAMPNAIHVVLFERLAQLTGGWTKLRRDQLWNYRMSFFFLRGARSLLRILYEGALYQKGTLYFPADVQARRRFQNVRIMRVLKTNSIFLCVSWLCRYLSWKISWERIGWSWNWMVSGCGVKFRHYQYIFIYIYIYYIQQPIGSMYGVYTYIWLIFMVLCPNVSTLYHTRILCLM